MGEEKEREKEIEEEILEKLEAELVEKAVPVVTTPPEHTKLLERINDMDERVEFVAGELWQRQGEKIGFTMGLLYGVMIGIVTYVIFLMA
ncbi:MAG: tetrahydromethanopterin S-methyltransferase subunit G [Methanosarcinales archaeon]|nr:tetrahydromethanopterin S-methyltransferase subunit G [Methanosarcinales archaeon]